MKIKVNNVPMVFVHKDNCVVRITIEPDTEREEFISGYIRKMPTKAVYKALENKGDFQEATYAKII